MQAYDEDVVDAVPPRRPGRRRDDSKDDVILEAARELIAERGYEGMTMDAVAERAGTGKATVYRRWPSKVELTVDAVICGRQIVLTVDDVPDTGSLRGDLMAMRGGARARRATTSSCTACTRPPRRTRRWRPCSTSSSSPPGRALMRGLLERAHGARRDRTRPRPRHDRDRRPGDDRLPEGRRRPEGRGPSYIERMIDKIILPLATGTSQDA